MSNTYNPQEADSDDFGINLGQVKEAENYDLIPRGQYPMKAVAVTKEPTKSGTGVRVSVQFELTQAYANRRVFENFNIKNPNPQAVEIALSQIRQWVVACRVNPNQNLTMSLLQSLIGIEFMGLVTIQVDKTGQYGDQNRIGRYDVLATNTMPNYSAPTQYTPQNPAPAPQPVKPLTSTDQQGRVIYLWTDGQYYYEQPPAPAPQFTPPPVQQPFNPAPLPQFNQQPAQQFNQQVPPPPQFRQPPAAAPTYDDFDDDVPF